MEIKNHPTKITSKRLTNKPMIMPHPSFSIVAIFSYTQSSKAATTNIPMMPTVSITKLKTELLIIVHFLGFMHRRLSRADGC